VAPDLVIEICVEGLSRRDAKGIAHKSRERGGIRIHAHGGLLSSSPGLAIPAAHDLLTDDADWDADTWAMDPDGLQEVASTVNRLFGVVDAPMILEALWGNQVAIVEEVSRAEMLSVIRAGALGTQTRYIVRPGSE
jgi:hypothetical protein